VDRKSTLKISGYRSGSTGEVANLRVRLVGSEGYRKILQEALEALQEVRTNKPEQFDGQTWLTACQELETEWNRSLLPDDQKPERKSSFTGQPSGNFWLSEDGEAIYLRNLLTEEREEIMPAAPVNSKPKTLAKNWIRNAGPMGAFIPMMKLQQGKFDEIKAE
jgi:hypothetical protein